MRFTTTIPGLTLFPGMGGQPSWSHGITTDQIRLIAERAERNGIDYLIVPWHMVIERGEGERNMGPRWPHPLAAAGFLLGATHRIAVMPLVVAPCHHPIRLAKSLATLDWMSGGRCVPVVLSGYIPWEFEVLGAAFEDRDAITDEYVEAMIELWSAESPSFQGEHVAFDDLVAEPHPSQRPFPLWFGGRSRASLRRIARHGAGWLSYATPHTEIPAALDYIRAAPGFMDRPIEVFAYFVEATHERISHKEAAPPVVPVGVDAVLARLEMLASCGVTVTTAPLAAWPQRGDGAHESFDQYIERLDWFGEQIGLPARQLDARQRYS